MLMVKVVKQYNQLLRHWIHFYWILPTKRQPIICHGSYNLDSCIQPDIGLDGLNYTFQLCFYVLTQIFKDQFTIPLLPKFQLCLRIIACGMNEQVLRASKSSCKGIAHFLLMSRVKTDQV